ncbi:hypothetical protein QJQ45_025531 [Haematococcus lacustris]|nr:hypothetical protein QJQ45_025531 [Haematococcus lacustris]
MLLSGPNRRHTSTTCRTKQMSSKRRPREEECAICGHFHDYEGGVPCNICGHVMSTHENIKPEAVIPTGVIPGTLYLGSYDTASRSEMLKAMGITHILNTVPQCQALFRNTFTYHTVAEAPPDFQECCDFIDAAIKQQQSKVLVHCMSGVSRGPSVVVAYLMKTRGWRLAESYKWVKDKRPSVNITPAESTRLMEWEMSLHGSCSTPQGLSALNAGCGFLTDSSTFSNPVILGQESSAAQAAQAGEAPVFGEAAGQCQWSLLPAPGAFVFTAVASPPAKAQGSNTAGISPQPHPAAGPGNAEMES